MSEPGVHRRERTPAYLRRTFCAGANAEPWWATVPLASDRNPLMQ